MKNSTDYNRALHLIHVYSLVPCLLFSIVHLAQAQVTVLYEGFEGLFPGDNGWTVRDSNSNGIPAYWDDVSTSFGGEGTHSGNWKGYCAGVGYAGSSGAPSYQNSMNASMSRNIDLSGYCAATLTFWHKIPSIETGCDVCDYEVCRVYIGSPLCVGCGPGFSTLLWFQRTPVADWTQVTIDLTPYVGGTYNLKFEFKSDGSVTYEGWYLDDILVSATRPPPATNVIVNFDALPSGTELTNQYPGVEFAIGPAGERLPVTEQVLAGANSVSNVLNITRPYAEFTKSYVIGYPTRPASHVSAAVGYFDDPFNPGATATVTLRAFTSRGEVRSQSAIVAEGNGFHRVLAVESCSADIVSFTVEASPDFGKFGLDDLVLSFPDGNFPDFTLQGPPGVTLVQGGPAVDVPITIRRFGGSSGPVSFSLGSLPAGVTASVLPNPSSGNSAVIRLHAAEGPRPGTATLLLTGNPVTGDAGPPGPRYLSIFVETVPNLRVSGPADINFAACSVSGTQGTIAQDYTVVRHPSVNGPIYVALEGLPVNVSGAVNPQVLTFPGGAVGENVNIRLTTIAGLTIPNTWATLHLTGSGIDTSFRILLHGRCPQEAHNFVMRGQFLCLNNTNVDPIARPIVGAQVRIYRDDPLWIDEIVATTYTDGQGRFNQNVYTSQDGEYYAKLRLYSPEVQVVDAENSQVWSFETPHRSNREGLMDFGSMVISKDNGAGTPRAAVWQGFREAVLEFQQTTGHGIPQGQLQVEIWRGHITPLTFYDEVHWAYGYQTGERDLRYRATFHEFGHAFRHVMDGSFAHWSYDNGTYIYGRSHGYCGIAEGHVPLEGFAFNEGWAEYWSWDSACCPGALNCNCPAGTVGGPTVEGTVAHHLAVIETNCRGIGRREMVQILEGAPERIHSIWDFRREFMARFPTNCVLPNLDADCGPPARSAMVPAEVQQENPPPTLYPELDVAERRAQLVAAINSLESNIAALQREQVSATGLRFFMLRAAIEEGTLVAQRMRDQLTALDSGNPPETFMQEAFLERFRAAQFVSQRKAIQLRALQEALEVVPEGQRADVERRILLLQESRVDDDSLDSLIPLLPIEADDRIPPACVTGPDGLVSWWPAAGTAYDLLANNNGLLQNGVSFAAGKVGQAFSFDGIDDRVLIGGAPIPPPWTTEVWVNRQDSPDDSAILLGDAATALKLEQWPNTRRVGFSYFGVADWSFNYTAPVGTWIHLALVCSGTSMRLYVNGALQETLAGSIALPLGQLGGDIDGRYANRLNGLVDELSVYNRSLSATEIQTIYAAGSAGKCFARPNITSIAKSGATVTVAWLAQPGLIYRVQHKASLDASVPWIDLGGDILATSNTANKTDSTAGGASQRFYRVVLMP